MKIIIEYFDRLGLNDANAFIKKLFPLFILHSLANQFLLGIYGWLDIIIHIISGIFGIAFFISMIIICWNYARSPESKTPYKQCAYFLLFIITFLAISIPLALLLIPHK